MSTNNKGHFKNSFVFVKKKGFITKENSLTYFTAFKTRIDKIYTV